MNEFNIILVKKCGCPVATVTVLDPAFFEVISDTLNNWLPRSFCVGELNIVVDDESEDE